MKIALSGTQGVGKTTLFNILSEESNFINYKFFNEIVRNLHKQYNIKINECGDDTTQLLIAGEHFKNTLSNDIITDRCMLDCWVYTKYLFKYKKINEELFNIIKYYFDITIEKYDHIFYISPEFDIIDDNFRSIDKQFQNDTHLFFIEEVNKYKHIHKINGSIEERIKQIKNIIKEKNNE